MPMRLSRPGRLTRAAVGCAGACLSGALLLATAGCSSDGFDSAPPTIPPAQAADSPPPAGRPAGVVWRLDQPATDAVFDAGTAQLAVLGAGPADQSVLTVFTRTGTPTPLPLPGPATALTGDGAGRLYAASRGGYFDVDLGTRTVTKVDVEGENDTAFTAITRRADGRIVLGTGDGAVLTIAAPIGATGRVDARVTGFAQVDDLVAQGDTTVVLDRAQTSVTALSPDGADKREALRAGEGATTMAADPVGRVLVADTRGGHLLVYTTDPLMLRQRYPVPDAPYGLAGSPTLAWVSQTATNTVVGYDLATGIPVEKVRYRTVRQPNGLAYDASSGTLYVVSGTGAGVQVIEAAGEADPTGHRAGRP